MTLRMIDTFSGIGGFSLAARWLGGIETVQFVEREPYCQRILSKHFPGVPIHDDICTYAPAAGAADLVVGGFPCQDISQAGAGAGIREGTRSGLFYELMRVVRLVGPRFVVLENVAAITHRGLDIVLGELAEAGFDAEWACIPASAVGACHRRDRWWLVAYATGTGARKDEPRLRGQRDRKDLLGDGHTDAEVSEQPAHAQGERWGTGPGQGAGQARREGPGTGDGAQGLTAHAQGQQRHDGGSADPAEPAGAAAESGDGDGADALDALRQRLEGRHQLGSGGSPWPAAPARLSPDWAGYASQPVIRRGDDGFPGRVDRLKALGNAVVPQVAMIPLARVLEMAADCY